MSQFASLVLAGITIRLCWAAAEHLNKRYRITIKIQRKA